MNKYQTDKRRPTHVQLGGSNARFYAFTLFMIIVFLSGGSSRDDVQSLVFLRPMAILFGAYALTCKTHDLWKGRVFPLYIALALAGVMLIQLLPLPFSGWSSLPGRQMFADIAELASIEQPWRPLTLSPSRTLNSLFSLAVPISAMMLYLNLEKHRSKQVIGLIIVLAGVSAFLAVFQLAGPVRGPLYLYDITNVGGAVGLFANRNHQAIFLAATIVMLGWYGACHPVAQRLATIKFYGSIAAIFVIMPLILVTGSRAGLILIVPAFVAAMTLIYFGRYTRESLPDHEKRRAKKRAFTSRHMILFVSIFLMLGIVALSIYFSRSLAFDRLAGRSDVEELRTQLLPIIAKMVSDYFPWGSGFGTFEHVYRTYEPHELLNPTYLNQAHNDWLQFPLEGGLPVALVGLSALIWMSRQLITLAKNWHVSAYSKYSAIMATVVLLIFLAGSIGDYPLRVPSLISIFAIMVCIFSDHVRSLKQSAITT